MGTLSLRPARASSTGDVRCPNCNKALWLASERLLLARMTRFPVSGGAEACCKICKTWVKVPLATVGT